jgi:hypothetical protein
VEAVEGDLGDRKEQGGCRAHCQSESLKKNSHHSLACATSQTKAGNHNFDLFVCLFCCCLFWNSISVQPRLAWNLQSSCLSLWVLGLQVCATSGNIDILKFRILLWFESVTELGQMVVQYLVTQHFRLLPLLSSKFWFALLRKIYFLNENQVVLSSHVIHLLPSYDSDK